MTVENRDLRRQTQTNLDPGNCWQTAVACVLDVDADELPPQVQSDARFSYLNDLNCYLDTHHNGLTYVEVHQPAIHALGGPALHVMSGPTVRTPTSGVNHVVVARHGEMLWDPHPSRAGLTAIERWGLRAAGHESVNCRCPRCLRAR